ncbi:MAG: hypothetical protein JMN24_13080 [gamma proteobacterium endosymbiont of Lamellibrachia anaximandri]|nr:hypothetical protein [gamma proteobacterium endosymbiont of Lamellibrachia anaximandri]MBL3617609.1 hypothetical protein [gamma proteobacterium endosymbiont of Lamellibrachia anaximandri]
MKKPESLRHKLRRQWQNGKLREQRLLDHKVWPLRLPIGKPSPAQINNEISAVRKHIELWRNVTTGAIDWQLVNYRSTAEAVQLPLNWVLHSTDEWIDAMANETIRQEYLLLSTILAGTDPLFHPLLIRQRQQLLSRGVEETIKACEVVLLLEPGCAEGKPLRTLSIAGCDSKFFERNRTLVGKLLELRFGQQVIEQGLEHFLGALDESEHWLLVAPLEVGLLPFKQQRVRSSELGQTPLPGSHLLIVENERSLYQLPSLPNTIAILGAGLNLSWMQAAWIRNKNIAYWGDIDTWGLSMLATARSYQPTLTPVLMDEQTFEYCNKEKAVAEPVTAGESIPSKLIEQEKALYLRLCRSEKGRLEQEFLPDDLVQNEIACWHSLA